MEAFVEFYRNHKAIITWLAVLFGGFSVFSYSLFLSFPQYIRQAVGMEILAYCTQDMVLRGAFAVFLGRLVTLIAHGPLFALFRVVFLQAPLSFSNFLPVRTKFWVKRKVVKGRRLSDGTLLLWITSPLAISTIFAFGLFFWTLVGEIRIVFTIAFTFAMVVFGGLGADEPFKKEWRLKFAYSKRRVNLSEIRAMGFSTAVLLGAFWVGSAEGDALLENAQELNIGGHDQKLVFVASEYFVSHRSGKNGEVWVLNDIEKLEEVWN
ncbi:hypothetical protein [Phaeobacter italicus]|uniref:hypothetical protein n=1 Tax=Phaeobacter italicus TaxID=481446 RepID=UPI001CD49F15|nr:hypothetical protein [Phaeobacter italicus]MCA0855481.1 hypothetical protein [Phaeobacter italicus]